MDAPLDIAALERYYRLCAPEYEALYYREDSVRREEIGQISHAMNDALHGRSVLEIACGTGFWTTRLSEVASSIVAIDSADEMLALARTKPRKSDRVRYVRADAYDLNSVAGEFNGALANFWLSHVPKRRIHGFLTALHARIGIGAHVFMADNVMLPAFGGVFVKPAGSDDSFRIRTLSDGSEHRIIKNYYEADDLRGILEPYSPQDLHVFRGTYYWWVSYAVGDSQG
jgi:SAM-dependent methyltransferase